MSAKVSTKTMLTLVAAVAFGAAGFAPASASAFSGARSFATSPAVKGPTVQPNRWVGWCARGPACFPPNAIFVRPRNPGNAVFAH
jgi:hypothetical protein